MTNPSSPLTDEASPFSPPYGKVNNTLKDMLDWLEKQLLKVQKETARPETDGAVQKIRIATYDSLIKLFTKTKPDLKTRRAEGQTAHKSGQTAYDDMLKVVECKLQADELTRITTAAAKVSAEIKALEDGIKKKTQRKQTQQAALDKAKIAEKLCLDRLASAQNELAGLPKSIQEVVKAAEDTQSKARAAITDSQLVDARIYLNEMNDQLIKLDWLIKLEHEDALIDTVALDAAEPQSPLSPPASDWIDLLHGYIEAVKETQKLTGEIKELTVVLDDYKKKLDDKQKNRMALVKAYYQDLPSSPI